MNTKIETGHRDDIIGLTLAVLMFALQGCMLLTMTTDSLAADHGALRGTVLVAGADDIGSGSPA